MITDRVEQSQIRRNGWWMKQVLGLSEDDLKADDKKKWEVDGESGKVIYANQFDFFFGYCVCICLDSKVNLIA